MKRLISAFLIILLFIICVSCENNTPNESETSGASSTASNSSSVASEIPGLSKTSGSPITDDTNITNNNQFSEWRVVMSGKGNFYYVKSDGTYRIDKNGNKTKISENQISDIFEDDEWIYGLMTVKDIKTTISTRHICKIRKSDNKVFKIYKNDNILEAFFSDEFILFRTHSFDDGFAIKKCDYKDENLVEILKGDYYLVSFTNKYLIYYTIDKTDDEKREFYKLNFGEDKAVKIADISLATDDFDNDLSGFLSFDIINDEIYYSVVYAYDYSWVKTILYKIDKNNNVNKVLSLDGRNELVFSNDKMFYCNNDGIFAADIDGNNSQRIYDNDVFNFTYTENTVYIGTFEVDKWQYYGIDIYTKEKRLIDESSDGGLLVDIGGV